MLGFGKGDVQIELPQEHYQLGDILHGRVLLNLTRPLQATALRVTLYTRRRINPHGRHRRTTEPVKIHHVDVRGAQTFGAGASRYPFSIALPAEAPSAEALDGISEEARRALLMVAGSSLQQPPTWLLEARLDVPWALDVSARISIAVTP